MCGGEGVKNEPREELLPESVDAWQEAWWRLGWHFRPNGDDVRLPHPSPASSISPRIANFGFNLTWRRP